MGASNCNSPSDCGCQPTLGRRELFQIAGASAGALALAHLGRAGEVLVDDRQAFEALIPPDKQLDPAWLKSLVARGAPEVLTGWDEQLKYVGMPIGGIGCGQLYLGGDGRLWLWDIFKSNYRREPDHGERIEAFSLGGHYAHPVAFGEEYTRWNGAKVLQGFAVRVKANDSTVTKPLDHHGFPGVTFRGEYPIGKVTYQDEGVPVRVELAAFSPFIPLSAKDSGLPATVMSFTVTNTSDAPVEADLVGWLQNATCPYVDDASLGQRRNRLVQSDLRVTLLQSVEPTPRDKEAENQERDDILFADFETQQYDGWTAEGDAFQPGPYKVTELPSYLTLQGNEGDSVVQSHNVRQIKNAAEREVGELVEGGDRLTGVLTSEPFTVERHYITFLISGGGHAERTCLNLLVDGKVVASKTGRNDHQMRLEAFDVRQYEGQQARLQVVDSVAGGWGNVCVDHILFTDRRRATTGIEERHGYGSMALSLLNLAEADGLLGLTALPADFDAEVVFSSVARLPLGEQERQPPIEPQVKPLDQQLVGALGGSLMLEPGESKTLDFAITWYFPDYNEVDAAPGFLSQLRDFPQLRRHYAAQFNSAGDVASYLATHRERLLGGTRRWNATWYDSTLPYWLLDRTFLTIDCAATQMLHWFDSGRLYGWEGVDCCPGTCTHVWHYAQGLARVFPELERSFREITDYGIAFHEDSGLIGYRAESHDAEATDGQAGTILRVYREHQMSADDAFLRRLWPKIKKSVLFLMAKDPDRTGLLKGAQPHTLDAAWHGPMGWISGLYLAAVAAGAAMAEEMGDDAFANECHELVDRGRENMASELFDGEYFIHKPDPNVPNAIRTGAGCHIDQALGQAWAHQVHLERVMPKRETVSALESLWRYNFAPDAGRYAIEHREIEQAFRWYAMPGESGLLMCTWPKGGAREAIPGDRLRPAVNPDVWTGPGGYFNECMNGFEYQVAAHMIYEGQPGGELVEKGLAVARAIHDRYAPAKRNPYNEIECSDHYARSMASYGVFFAVCGFEYHGPLARIGFAPRVSPADFRAPFTSAEGWGTFRQVRDGMTQTCSLEVRWGSVKLKTFATAAPPNWTVSRCSVVRGTEAVAASYVQTGTRVEVTLTEQQVLNAESVIEFRLS